jgi:DNA topoisomerase IB
VRWRALRDKGKFGGLLEFGALLPTLRRHVRHDLAQPGLPREKVLALIVRLLEETLIRVGNERYTRDNHSYGLTTLRSRHVRTVRGRLRFTFRGKSGQTQEAELDDTRLARVVRHLQQLPGQKLFQYLDGAGHRRPVDSGEVNGYLRAACGSDFSAKDFRTWGGTLEAARILVRTPRPAEGEPVQRAALAEAIKQVAAALGNTPAVCRASYIHPQIIEGWLDDSLHAAIPLPVATHPRQLETAVLRFLRRRLRTAKRSPTANRRLKNAKRA